MIVFLSLLTIFIAYIALILVLYLRWRSVPVWKEVQKVNGAVSVVIPYRNEEENLPLLLRSISEQEVDGIDVEVIFVNDHSEDGGPELIADFSKKVSFDLINVNLGTEESGKKSALKRGVEAASHPIILQTDADCSFGPSWLKTMIAAFAESDIRAVLGPVNMLPAQNFWSRFASLEFMSLQATGASLCLMEFPVMSNGANMAYYREDWLRHSDVGRQLSSGDDTFFIQALSRSGRKVAFAKSWDALVETRAPDDFNPFIRQRVRWGAKTSSYLFTGAKVLAVMIALLNLGILMLTVVGIWYPWYLAVAGGILIFKMVIDGLLLRSYSTMSGQQGLMKSFVLASLIYPVYISYAVALVVFYPAYGRWKGRRIKV